MGSSSKKKKEKKKDFQKTKLRIGKDKPKAANFTDTSFKAKSIVLNKQSISIAAPSASSQFSHHVSLLRSKSDTQRRDSLAYLTNVASVRKPGSSLPELAAVLIPKLQPLMLDASNSVRQELLRLLKCFSNEEVVAQVDQLLLYTRAGMTHLASEIRLFALEILEWLLNTAGLEVITCPGGWMQTMNCFLGLLGWRQDSTTDSWSAARVSYGRPGGYGRALSKELGTLSLFIKVALTPPTQSDVPPVTSFPYSHWRQHHLPERSNAFADLNLFGAPRDEENGMYEDWEDRRRLFATHFQAAIENGTAEVKGDGGELGRVAAGLERIVKQSLLKNSYEM